MNDYKRKPETKVLAIVGGGPRGLSALESIYKCSALEEGWKSMNTILFENMELPGAGHIYAVDQPDTNWLNVSERGLTIPQRDEIRIDNLLIPKFPSYQEWVGYDSKTQCEIIPDNFPSRSTLGKYLNERYQSIASILERDGFLKLVRGNVVKVDWEGGKFSITLQDGATSYSDELVLAVGHQPTKNSDQISKWSNYSKGNSRVDLKTDPYPISEILKSDTLNNNSVVAIRGFGLAMIDVMRALTVGLGGKFEIIDKATQKMKYFKSGKEPTKIVPFSLDGLPMAPKLLNLKIDKWFFPTKAEKEDFCTTVNRISEKGNATNIRFLIDAITPIISRVFIALESKAYKHDFTASELHKIISSWLLDEEFENSLIVPRDVAAIEMLEDFVGMATETKPISIDFCIGHVWRHCQPTLYKALSFSNLDDEIIASIIQLDERLKRYSYGPPVGSLQQLLALIKAEVLSLDYVKNPEIRTMETGWELSTNKDSIVANVMVNSVLDPPKLLDINSSIVRNLLHESLVKPKHGELGIETYKNACVLLPKERDGIPLAVLGRLSKGTLIGVDAILECFGDRSDRWAKGVMDRHI